MTDEVAYEFWICRKCLTVSGAPDPEHEHGPLEHGYWIAAEVRADELTVAEFREQGYLQEVNRRFLHPLGLALVAEHVENFEVIRGVRDARADPEGIIYAAGTIPDAERERADRITAEWVERSSTRLAALGYVVQPIEET
jgi:hypothetical protein